MDSRRSRVLIVDKDPVFRLEVERQLEVLGWEAVAIDNGEDAIRIVELGFVVDVLLNDVGPPDTDGLAIARAVVRLSPKTRVVFVAASTPTRRLEPDDAQVLIKPFTPDELVRALAGVKSA